MAVEHKVADLREAGILNTVAFSILYLFLFAPIISVYIHILDKFLVYFWEACLVLLPNSCTQIMNMNLETLCVINYFLLSADFQMLPCTNATEQSLSAA